MTGYWSGKVWTLRGSINAEHYYARIRTPEGDLMDVEQLMSAELALELSDKSERSLFGGGHRFEHHAGEPTNCFKLQDETRGALICALKHLAQPGEVAVIGDPMYSEPHEPVAGPEEFMEAATALWLEWTALMEITKGDPFTHSPVFADQLAMRWVRIIDPYEAEQPAVVIYGRGAPERRQHPREVYVRPDAHGVWEVFTGDPFASTATTTLTTPSEEKS